MDCSFGFAFVMGLTCYFIGFFFGRITKKFAKKKDEECVTYEDTINREG